MNVRKDINEHASPDDQKILHWLFDRYHFDSQWRFVAACRMVRYGKMSYEFNRVWSPTVEGRAIYAQLSGNTQKPVTEAEGGKL